MKKLQGETVKQASEELKVLTNIFSEWGQSLYQGDLGEEKFTAYELGGMTANNMEVVERVSYDKEDDICDDFSLYQFTESVLEKLKNE